MLQATPIPQWAAFYRMLGIQVVPSLEPSEDPLNWKRPVGQWKQHTRTPVSDDTFAGWYGEFGQHVSRTNLGIITGAVSGGLFIVDIDTYRQPGALHWYSGLLAVHNNDMALETPTQRTGGGGLQMLFRAPDGWRPPTGKTTLGVDIRGEGGFAVLPPSRHSSGKEYEWLPGQCPDEVDVATAPDWLCAAIDALLGVQPELAPGAGNGVTDNVVRMPRTPTPAAALTPIGGFRQDLREEYMRDLVWAAVVGLWRECPYIDAATADINARKVWQDYLAHTESRLAGSPETLAARLEQEGRGWSLFCDKWRRAMAQWNGKVAAAGRLPDPHPGGPALPPHDPATGEIHEDAAKTTPPVLSFTPYTWLDPATIPQRRFLYGRHYIRQFLSTDISPGGVGKSSLAIADAVAMAAHKDLLGTLPTERCRVAYWNGEDPLEELQRRVQAVCLHYGITAGDIAGRLFIDSGRLLPLIVAKENRQGVTLDHAVIDAIIASIQAHGIDALIIDPFIASHRVSENDNNAIELVAKVWSHIADVTHCAVNLVHHSRKTNGEEVTVEAGRGASALLAACRSARTLNQMTENEAERSGVKNRRLYFRVDDGKANLQPPTEQATWYRIANVDLPNGPMSTIGDKVGVVTGWTMPDALGTLNSKDLRAVQNAIGAGKWRENVQARDWVGIAIAKALGLTLPGERSRVKSLIRIWLDNGALVRIAGVDQHREERTYVEVGNWVEPDA